MARGCVSVAPPVHKVETPNHSATLKSRAFYQDEFCAMIEYDGQESEKRVRDPNDEDVVGIPPIIGYVENRFGIRVPITEPIPGFEHLLNPGEISQHFQRGTLQEQTPESVVRKPENPSTNSPLIGHRRPTDHHDCSQETVHHCLGDPTNTPRKPRQTTKDERKRRKTRALKRSRSAAQLGQDNDEEDESDDGAGPSTNTIHAKFFFVGDEPELRRFLATKCRELTLKPLKKIATYWLEIAEPRRCQLYGSYNQKNQESPLNEGPSWWPKKVPYREPAHLKGAGLAQLCVEILLLHKQRDSEGKPRYQWVKQLKQSVDGYIMMAKPANFAAAKGTQYNIAMKERAEKVLLPDIFNAAQAYEDHVAMWGLEDGKESQHPASKEGTQIAWFPPTKPDRLNSKSNKGKRARCDDDAEVAEDSREMDPETQEDSEDDEQSAPLADSQMLIPQGPTHSSTLSPRDEQSVPSHELNSPRVAQQLPTEQPARFSRAPSVSTSYHGLPMQVPTFPTTPSFVHSMDGLSIGSSFGSCTENEPTVGTAFEMQQPPGNVPPNGSLIYPQSVWTEDRFVVMAPRTYPQSVALTATPRLTQPYSESPPFPIQDTGSTYCPGNTAYHMTNMEEKPPHYPIQYGPHMVEDGAMMLGVTHSPVVTMPQDVIMASPGRTRYAYLSDGRGHHPDLSY